MFSAVALLVILAVPAQAGTINVTTTADQHGAQNSKCALREAIVAANTDADFGGCNDSADPDTVALGAKRYKLTRDGADEQQAQTGDLDLTEGVRIRGKGMRKTILDGDKEDRVLDAPVPIELRVSDLTLTGGKTPQFSGGALAMAVSGATSLTVLRSAIRDNVAASGAGGLTSGGAVTIRDSIIEDNRATDANGGISVLGMGSTLLLKGSTVARNRTGSFGGGVYTNATTAVIHDSVIRGNKALDGEAGGIETLGGSLDLEDSVVKGNKAEEGGGGIHLQSGDASIHQTTLAKNKTKLEGGGIFAEGTAVEAELERVTMSGNRAGTSGGGLSVSSAVVRLLNTTLSGNRAREDGGGIFVGGTSNNAEVTLNNATVADNVADSDNFDGGTGGGIFRFDGAPLIYNSILADNYTGSGFGEPDCDGGIGVSYSLITNDCPGIGSNNIIDMEAELHNLKHNGGPTKTQAPRDISPALEAANPATPGSSDEACLTTDQRGELRPGGPRCDMGAFEAQG